MASEKEGWQHVVAWLGGVLAGVSLFAFVALAARHCRFASWAFWAAAFGASTFYGFGALAVWRAFPPPDQPPSPPYLQTLPVWPWRVHQIWLNGLGSLVGWGAMYLLLNSNGHRWSAPDVTPTNGVLMLVTFLGITGWLPATITGFAMALRKLADKAVDTIAK